MLQRGGGVAEWFKAAVLKTAELQGSVGSNPTPSAMYRNELRSRDGGSRDAQQDTMVIEDGHRAGSAEGNPRFRDNLLRACRNPSGARARGRDLGTVGRWPSRCPRILAAEAREQGSSGTPVTSLGARNLCHRSEQVWWSALRPEHRSRRDHVLGGTQGNGGVFSTARAGREGATRSRDNEDRLS